MANEAYFIIQRKYLHEHMKVLSFFIAFSTICYLPDIRLMHQTKGADDGEGIMF